MFGADATVQAWYDRQEQSLGKTCDRGAVEDDRNNIAYLYPKLSVQQPWLTVDADRDHFVGEDFILIAEFSEQEGPRPVIIIPKDGGEKFDKNEFCVKILSVDHQSSFVEGCHMTEDTQVVMSDVEKQVYAFVHHFVLNDIQARGYVRPFCITYVTSDQRKLMSCYEELSQEMKKVASLVKYGNRLVFMRDLEKHQEDLSYTKARLLITQKYMTSSTQQNDSDLLGFLNALRQSMEEVRDILSKLRPLLNDKELEERFQQFEKSLKSSSRQQSRDSISLDEFDHQSSQEDCPYGSLTETVSPEFSLFNKSRDQKPKFLDVSIIKGKRRFDRSLRGLHELCSWGAKDGLQRLRLIREFFRRDLLSTEIDSSVLSPDYGILSFGLDLIGANFLSPKSSLKSKCWKKSSSHRDSQENLVSLGSLDSFKSLSSSFQSFIGEDEMYSAKSSVMDNQSSVNGICFEVDAYSSKSTSDTEHENLNKTIACHAVYTDMDQRDAEVLQSIDELETTLNDTLLNTAKETVGERLDNDFSRPRSSTTYSEFDEIDILTDVKCNSKSCSCLSTYNSNSRTSIIDKNMNNQGVVQSDRTMFRGIPEMPDPVNATMTLNEKCPFCNNNTKVSNASLDKNCQISGDLVSQPVYVDNDGIGASKSDSYFMFDKDVNHENVDETICAKMSGSNENCKKSFHISGNLKGITEAFQPHAEYSINEISSDVIEQYTSIINSTKGTNMESMHCMPDHAIDMQRNTIYQTVVSVNMTEEGICNEQSFVESKESFTNPEGISGSLHSYVKNCNSEAAEDLLKRYSNKFEIETKTSGIKTLAAYCNENRILDDGNINSSTDTNKLKEVNGQMLGIRKEDSHPTNSSTERSSGEEVRHRHIRKKSRLSHPFKDLPDSIHLQDQSLQKILTSYNNLQHVVNSLLSGRPVVVIGTKRHEAALMDLLQALSIFVPTVSCCDQISLLCQIKQMKIVDLHTFLLRGIIRSEKKCLDYIIPKSIRKYLTLFDVEKSLISCIPYQGSLLNFIGAIYHKKKVFKSEQALRTYIQMCLMEISSKAFSFYHCMCVPDADTCNTFNDVTLTRKCSMLELSVDKYLSKVGIQNSDITIMKHLAEIVKIQQIDEEFKCRSLTDNPVYPFTIAYNTVQTFRG